MVKQELAKLDLTDDDLDMTSDASYDLGDAYLSLTKAALMAADLEQAQLYINELVATPGVYPEHIVQACLAGCDKKSIDAVDSLENLLTKEQESQRELFEDDLEAYDVLPEVLCEVIIAWGESKRPPNHWIDTFAADKALRWRLYALHYARLNDNEATSDTQRSLGQLAKELLHAPEDPQFPPEFALTATADIIGSISNSTLRSQLLRNYHATDAPRLSKGRDDFEMLIHTGKNSLSGPLKASQSEIDFFEASIN